MRINLVTPFAEKDQAKALGARWDSTRKVWYIQDVEDLSPFLRWIPDLEAATESSAPVALKKTASKAAASSSAGVITTSKVGAAHCGCDVLPWEDCEHTLKR